MKTLAFISYSISAPVVDLVAESIAEAAPDEWDIPFSSPLLGADDFYDAEEDIDSIFSEKDKLDISPSSGPPLTTVAASEQDLVNMTRTVIEFIFQVGEVSVSLQKTDESTLAELNIYDFGLKFISRPFDYKAVIHIASAQLLDNMQQSEKFQYILSKATGVAGEEESQKFITIVFDSVNRTSPQFKGTDQAADILFGGIYYFVSYCSCQYRPD
jgi:hypothetical protein